MGLFDSASPFKGQRFETLRRKHRSLGVPFTDPLFPASNSSVFFSKRLPGKVEWKRPGEICSKPKLFDGGISAGDVFQGQLGNCWFVAACSVLAGVKELWHKVIPDYKDQEWDLENPDSYAGIFHFRFWRFGEWTDVVIDDLLPTVQGRLIFTHSQSKNEFWSALLEKAYAKVNGSYEALDGGNLSDALVDFTSGVSETIELAASGYATDEDKRKELFRLMLKQKENHALMCCAVAATNRGEIESRTAMGLVKGHAYGITAVRKVNLKDTRLLAFLRGREKVNMVRLRNPWGEKEWTGAFSDGNTGSGSKTVPSKASEEQECVPFLFTAAYLTRVYSRSPEWARISVSEREKLGLTFEEDGEFWMTFDDFVTHFTEVSICHLLNTSVFTLSQRWQEMRVFGSWTSGARGTESDRSGGCANNRISFTRNPQYCFDIASDGEEVAIQLSQKDVREKKQEGAENLVIGFHVLKVEVNRKYRLHLMQETAGTSDYIRTRSVFLRKHFQRGRYVLLPTTFAPGQFGEYLLRFFSTCDTNFHQLKKEVPSQSICPCIQYPIAVTMVIIRSVSGLLKSDAFGTADPYCIIKCGKERVRSHIVKDSLDATWNTAAVFYRNDLSKPVKIQVWNSNLVVDTFMGQALLEAPVSHGRKATALELHGRGTHRNEKKPGKVTVEFHTEDDLLSI